MVDEEIPELTETELAQWQAAASAFGALAESAMDGTLDTEGVAATFAQVGQIPLDPEQFVDALHVPEDAGTYEGALGTMLRRIPDGWGRWISCDAGWYPLITALDADLVALVLDYVLQQVKEKYGTLSYYAELPPAAEPACCMEFNARHPRPEVTVTWGQRPTTEQEEPLRPWRELLDAHFETKEHEAGSDAVFDVWDAHNAEFLDRFHELIAVAEKRSATICERCGADGVLCASAGWYKTLCGGCIEALSAHGRLRYVPVRE